MTNKLTTRVEIKELIKILKKNRKRHEQIYTQAMKGYKKAMIKAFQKKLDDAKKGKIDGHCVDVPVPSSHLKQYDQLIGMLEMTADTHMVLDEDQFSAYVRDEWSWKGSFINSANPHGVTLNDVEKSYLI